MIIFVLILGLMPSEHTRDISLETYTKCLSMSFDHADTVSFNLLFSTKKSDDTLYIDLHCTKESKQIVCRQVGSRIDNNKISLTPFNPSAIVTNPVKIIKFLDGTLMIRTTPTNTFYINNRFAILQIDPVFSGPPEIWEATCQE